MIFYAILGFTTLSHLRFCSIQLVVPSRWLMIWRWHRKGLAVRKARNAKYMWLIALIGWYCQLRDTMRIKLAMNIPFWTRGCDNDTNERQINVRRFNYRYILDIGYIIALWHTVLDDIQYSQCLCRRLRFRALVVWWRPFLSKMSGVDDYRTWKHHPLVGWVASLSVSGTSGLLINDIVACFGRPEYVTIFAWLLRFPQMIFTISLTGNMFLFLMSYTTFWGDMNTMNIHWHETRINMFSGGHTQGNQGRRALRRQPQASEVVGR